MQRHIVVLVESKSYVPSGGELQWMLFQFRVDVWVHPQGYK